MKAMLLCRVVLQTGCWVVLGGISLLPADACAEEWTFEKGLPSDCSLRPLARVGGGGLTTSAVTNTATPAGCLVDPSYRLPEAFVLEAEFTPTKRTHEGGILFDSLYINYPPHCDNRGFQVVFTGRNYWTPEVYFGFSNRTCKVTGPTVRLAPGKRARFKMTYRANRRADIEFGNLKSFGVLPVAGAVVPAPRPFVIGDRVGANYDSFQGTIHRLSVTPIKKRLIELRTEGRTSFCRFESEAKLKLVLENFGAGRLEDVQVELPSGVRNLGVLNVGETRRLEVPIETRVTEGDYRLNAAVSVRDASGKTRSSRCEVKYAIGPQPCDRFPVQVWGFEAPVAALADLGFTHGLTRFGFEKLRTADDSGEMATALLDEALACGVTITKGVEFLYPEGVAESDYWRVTRTGAYGHYEGAPRMPEMCAPELKETATRLAKDNLAVFGDHPAFGGILPVSEWRDHIFPSFRHEHERYRRETGREVPPEVNDKTLDPKVAAKRYPDGVVPEDDPVLSYYRWFWDGGDGWPDYLSNIAEAYRHVRSRPFFSFWDPAVRCPPRWGSGGAVDVLNQWVYADPEPLTVAGPVEELFAMSEGRKGQEVMIMTQLICYRSSTAPKGVAVDPMPEWARRLPNADFISIPPDLLQEATWSMIAKPVKGVMYHGWGTVYDTGDETGYCLTNPETAKRLRHLLKDVVAPLGPTLRRLGRDRQPVAVLESATTCLMGGPASWGWSAPSITFLQRARLDPRVVYEQGLLRDGLDDVKVLYAPQCQYLTPSVIEKIRAFQKRGGTFVADEQCVKALVPDVTVPVVSFEAPPLLDNAESMEAKEASRRGDVQRRLKTLNAKAAMLRQAEDLRRSLAGRHAPEADSSTPEIVTFLRKWKDVRYLFAINDKRTFGDYIGLWGYAMEKGLPIEGTVTLADPAKTVGAVYELSKGGEVPFAREDARVSVKLDYRTNDGRLLMFLPERIAALRVDHPKALTHGGTCAVTLSVVGTSGKTVPALLPVEIHLLDPSGREIDGSGWTCAEDGRATAEIRLNVEGLDGNCKLVCRDRASGLSYEAQIPLANK